MQSNFLQKGLLLSGFSLDKLPMPMQVASFPKSLETKAKFGNNTVHTLNGDSSVPNMFY